MQQGQNKSCMHEHACQLLAVTSITASCHQHTKNTTPATISNNPATIYTHTHAQMSSEMMQCEACGVCGACEGMQQGQNKSSMHAHTCQLMTVTQVGTVQQSPTPAPYSNTRTCVIECCACMCAVCVRVRAVCMCACCPCVGAGYVGGCCACAVFVHVLWISAVDALWMRCCVCCAQVCYVCCVCVLRVC